MRDRPSNPSSSELSRAAQYLRMSTEHQQYSILNQSAAIALYAAAHNFGIVRSFVDEGKGGTSIKGREGLQELLRVVESGTADFTQILVYDISRWGRFPDSDEVAGPGPRRCKVLLQTLKGCGFRRRRKVTRDNNGFTVEKKTSANASTESAPLGALAVGAPALNFWRRKEDSQ
jgi:hypothetical protein